MTSETTAKKDVQKLQRAIVDGLEDVKAQDIVVFNTEHLSPLFERVIIACGTSNRQTKALAASVRDAVREAGFDKPRVEGEDNGEWIIVDCGAAVVHVMQPLIRKYYHLEEIWGEKPVRLKHGAPQPAGAKSLMPHKPAKPTKATKPAKASKGAKSAPVAEPAAQSGRKIAARNTKAAAQAGALKAGAQAASAASAVKRPSAKSAAPVAAKPASRAGAKSVAKPATKAVTKMVKAPAAKQVVPTVVVKPKTPRSKPVAAKTTGARPASKAAAKPAARPAAKPAAKSAAKAPVKATTRRPAAKKAP